RPTDRCWRMHPTERAQAILISGSNLSVVPLFRSRTVRATRSNRRSPLMGRSWSLHGPKPMAFSSLTLGGTPRQLVRAARAHTPHFSPDGRSITYWTGLPVTVSVAAGASGSIFVVPVAGGLPRALVPDFATARHPVWSPDSRHLLFIGNRAADNF